MAFAFNPLTGNLDYYQPASGSGITIGTTTITSGTDTRILYNNAGVVGEYTLTGTGTVVVMKTAPTILTTMTLSRDAVGVTSADGVVLVNATAAAAGAQQYSPRLRLTGQGWKTTATAASQTVDWIVENRPVQGAANPTTTLAIGSQVNAGGYTDQLTITSAGLATFTGPVKVPDGSAGTPSFQFTSSVGLFCASNFISCVFGGANYILLASSGYGPPGPHVRSDGGFSWDSATNFGGSTDLELRRAAAATLQMGTDANGAAVSQTIQACNGIVGTDKTGGNFTLASGKGTGAGAVSSLIFQTPTVLGSGTTAQSLATRLTLSSAGASIVGGTTDTGSHIIENATAIPAGGTAGKGYKFSSTSNYGVFFGSGAPTLAAAKGSLYLRSDGSGTTDRAYVNTDGSTTWTALTTVA